MRGGLLSVFVVLALAVACADRPREATSPTGPMPALDAVEAPATPSMSGATVCLSYGRDRERVRSKLRAAPADAKLQAELKSLDELILDAC